MNRATRDKFASGTDQVDVTTGNACWQTAPAVFEKLEADFGPFDVDLTADAQRALCDVWLGPGSPHGLHAHDALQAPWYRYGRCGYSNPPYGAFIGRLLPIARCEAGRGFASTLLLPLRITKAFRAYVLRGAAQVLLCDKRLVFFENGMPRLNQKTGKPDSALFDSVIVRYLPGTPADARPVLGEWQVPKHAVLVDGRWR